MACDRLTKTAAKSVIKTQETYATADRSQVRQVQEDEQIMPPTHVPYLSMPQFNENLNYSEDCCANSHSPKHKAPHLTARRGAPGYAAVSVAL